MGQKPLANGADNSLTEPSTTDNNSNGRPNGRAARSLGAATGNAEKDGRGGALDDGDIAEPFHLEGLEVAIVTESHTGSTLITLGPA